MKRSDENLPVTGQVTDENSTPRTSIPECQDEGGSCPSPRPLARPVSLKGHMGPDGYEPENAEWWETLTYPAAHGAARRYGLDPQSIPAEVLTAAGHGPRRVRAVVRALGDGGPNCEVRGYKDLRRHCLACAENPSEVRRCAVIDCPAWAFRTGRNPHNPRRGRNPFAQRCARS